MRKVLIADDEYLVRLGLKTTINWEEQGYLIVGEAKNGKEAVELFERYDPDILLTDIRMPVMDGLELIQQLKRRKKTLRAVILTHYDDFNYAREAIKLGASEYLLKSDLSQENLLGVLKRLSDEMQSTIKETETDPGDHMSENLNIEAVLNELLKRIVTGDFRTGEEISRYLERYHGIFEYDSGIFFTAILDEINNTSYDNDGEFFSKTVKNVLSQAFDDMSQAMYIEKNTITCMIHTMASTAQEDLLKSVYNNVLSFKKSLKQFLDIESSIGISRLGNTKEDMLELLAQSKEAQKQCFFIPEGVFIYNEDMVPGESAAPKIKLEVLKGHVKILDTEQVISYIHEIFDKLAQTRRIDFVRNIFIDFLSYARIITNELNVKDGPALNEVKFSYGNFDRLNTLDAVKKYVTDIYCAIIDYISGKRTDKYSYIIWKSINFIKENYQKNITLADAANSIEISKGYLSLLFKQETGTNFSSFLTNYRIEIAKKLIASSNDKLYEIAEKVGFENPYYFSKVFKEITGMTCKDFKNNITMQIE